MPTQSLSELALKKVLNHLDECMEGEKASTLFVCGGRIIFPKGNIQSVRCCWTPNNDSYARWLQLPASSNDKMAAQLAADCQPASFDRGQENVMDLECCKAGKLEPSQVLTNFNPAECGIIDEIVKLLAPHLITWERASMAGQEIRAELYKLNVHSGPSGFCKRHVDMPGSPNKMGTLVVCLPSSFKGGNLIVRHDGNEVDFAWDHHSSEALQWAAFYGDCEHEVTKVSEGHRITLIYNLFVEPVNASTPLSPMIEPESLPFYGIIKSVLQVPIFMRSGGVLGFFCSHAYPHASKDVKELPPRGLKGSDLGVYAVLQSLGFEPEVLPVCVAETDIEDPDDPDNYYATSYDVSQVVLEELLSGNTSQGNSSEEGNSPSKVHFRHVSRSLKTIVGSELHPYSQANNGGEENFHELLGCYWGVQKEYEKPITWIASPTNCEEALGYSKDSDEYIPANIYSFAAIMVEIPPWGERKI